MNKSKINTSEFILRSTIKHGEKYDYSQTIYTASNKKLKIICPTHGAFYQSADEHMRGRGCNICGAKKCDTSKFIEKAEKIHKNKYDYSLVKYIKSSNKIKVICKTHGVFEQIAQNHLSGQGCSKCSGNINLTTNDFIEKAEKIHDKKYDYSLVKYKNIKTKIEIICNKHGIFLQKPAEHINQKQGCPKCAGVGRNTKDFILDANEKHNDKYDYSKTCYEKHNKDITINCPIHGEFKQKPYIHLMGSGCQKCSESKGERKIVLFLEKNNIVFEKQKTFTGCSNNNTNRLLKFDFYLPKLNLCIEYDGEYHYEPWRMYFDKDTAYKKHVELKMRDEIKTNYCKKQKINLLRIPYFKIKNIEEIIFNYLSINN